MVYKASNETMISENLKQYVFLVMKLEIILLTCMANDEQDQLLRYINKLKSKTKSHLIESKKVIEDVLNSVRARFKGREMVFKASESGIFLNPEESKYGKGLKILAPNQMLKRLPIALPQIKAGNNSEIRQIVYSLYRSKVKRNY